MTLHIHRPASFGYRAVLKCRHCGQRRRCIVELYGYYDPTIVCCRCGLDPRQPRRRKTTKPMRAGRARELWGQYPTRDVALAALIAAHHQETT